MGKKVFQTKELASNEMLQLSQKSASTAIDNGVWCDGWCKSCTVAAHSNGSSQRAAVPIDVPHFSPCRSIERHSVRAHGVLLTFMNCPPGNMNSLISHMLVVHLHVQSITQIARHHSISTAILMAQLIHPSSYSRSMREITNANTFALLSLSLSILLSRMLSWR